MSAEPATPTDVPRLRKPLEWGGVVRRIFFWAVVLVVIAAVGWGIFSHVAGRTLEGEIARLRAAGKPLTFEEWDKAQPAVAEADDAAPFYKAALSLYQGSATGKVNDLQDRLDDPSTRTRRIPSDLDGEIKQVLADNAQALEMVDRGSSRPQCAFDLGVSHGIGPMLGPFTPARGLAKLLRLRTVWLARRGQTRKAVDSLVSSFRMLRMFDRQPVLVAYLTKIACVALHVDALGAVLEGGSLSDQQLATLEQALARADPTKELERIYAMGRLYTLAMCRFSIGLPERLLPPDKTPFAETAPPTFLLRPLARLIVADALRMTDRFVEAARKDWPEALEAAREAGRSHHGVFSFFSRLLIPAEERAFELFGRTIGRVRSAQVAVMVERYRLAKRRLPVSLEELRAMVGGELPADPFTGKDLVYRVQGKGFVVYSVGEDKADGGGPEQPPKEDFGVVVHRAR
ncbi:MAG: hypothetical protein MUP47_06910 [Phycisphaerae bacterium]|nr:hypothetical protein [Phycisphaerae bacterium]